MSVTSRTNRGAVPSFLRDGKYAHVEEVLDREPTRFQRLVIPPIWSNVRIDESVVESIRALAATGPVVYALKHRTLYDLQFLRMRFAELGLPVPCFAFGLSAATRGSVGKAAHVWTNRISDYVRPPEEAGDPRESALREILEQGGAATFFLVDEKNYRETYVHPDRDPLRIIAEAQGRMAAPIVIIPLTLLHDRSPRRTIRPFWDTLLGDSDRPGALRRVLNTVKKWTEPELIMGEPCFLLSEFEEFGGEKSWEELPYELRRELTDSVNARIRVARGPEQLTGTEIKERVLQTDRVQRAVRAEASKKNIPIEKARKKAEGYVDEIAADQRASVIQFLYHFLKWIFSHVFDGIDLKERQFEPLKQTAAKAPLILVPSHKSHFDYLLIPWLMFVNRFALPHIAAGKNLSFWPLGPFLRRGGAFFLRRSFKGLSLYTDVFAAYVHVLLEEKYTIKFFIEGGRSRTGKLLQPRLGILGFLLEAVESGIVDDIYFSSVFAGYEQIPEEKSYIEELSGIDKKKESIGSVIGARKILKKRFGKVYARFRPPVSYREFCGRWNGGVDPNSLSAGEVRNLRRDFGLYLMDGIVRASVVTVNDLTAGALVSAGGSSVSLAKLLICAAILETVLGRLGAEYSGATADLKSVVENALALFADRGLLRREDGDGAVDPVYSIEEQRSAHIFFYRNALVNHFWPSSFLAMILTRPDLYADEPTSAIIEEFRSLKDLCSGEIIVNPLESDEKLVDRTFAMFRENGWLDSGWREGAGWKASSPLHALRSLLADMIEVYYLVLAAGDRSEAAVSPKDLTKLMAATADELRDGDEERVRPSLSPLAIRTAIGRFNELGILSYGESSKVDRVPGRTDEKRKWLERLAAALGYTNRLGGDARDERFERPEAADMSGNDTRGPGRIV